jgi:hypothetical protein
MLTWLISMMMMTRMMMILMTKIPQLLLRLKMQMKRTLLIFTVKFTMMEMMIRELNKRKTMKTIGKWRENKRKLTTRRSSMMKTRKTQMINRKLKVQINKLISRLRLNKLLSTNLE